MGGRAHSLNVTRSFARGTYFDEVEVKDGVAIIRIDGPQKMNVIDDGFRQEMETLWTVRYCSLKNQIEIRT